MNREAILEACFAYVHNKIAEVTLAMESAGTSLQEDTKSSAGDKYETGREMIQQDLNRFQQQISLAQEDLHTLQRIKQTEPSATVSLGTVLKTDKHNWYFIAISIGRLQAYPDLFVISPVSPIGKLLLGKRKGDKINFNNESFMIDCVL